MSRPMSPLTHLRLATASLAEHTGPIPADLGADILNSLSCVIALHGQPMSMVVLDRIMALVEALRNEITA